jgi:orotate phosphoribosyltransferase
VWAERPICPPEPDGIGSGEEPASAGRGDSFGATRLFTLADALPSRDHDLVDTPVTQLALPQRGHFDLGTGYHGDVWLDLDALFLRPALLRPHVRWLADRLSEHQVDAVCGPMEGGAFLAQAIADRLETAFLPAYRAAARRATEELAYRLPHVPGGVGGWRVAIADDAVNAGTAVQACSRQVRDCGAVPVAVAALLSLGPASVTMAARLSLPFYAAETMQSQAWAAGHCPLCASGTPLTDLSSPG